MSRDVYSGRLKLLGEEHRATLLAANNYADSLNRLGHFEEVKSLMCKLLPVARRVLGENDDLTFRMRWMYATALYYDRGATRDDLREAVTTLEETAPTARRVLGPSHPSTKDIVRELRNAQAALAAREIEPLREAVGAMGV